MWNFKQDEAFKKVKELLTKAPVLQHYDETKKLILACDAAPYGLGVVLSHLHDGDELPIAFASRTLTSAENTTAKSKKNP